METPQERLESMAKSSEVRNKDSRRNQCLMEAVMDRLDNLEHIVSKRLT